MDQNGGQSVKEKQKTGVLVIAGPEDSNRSVWISDVRDLLSAGHEVHLYLIDRGVLHMMEDDFLDPGSDGLRLYACSYGSTRYGVPLTKPAVFSGLTVLSNLLKGCQQFVTIPPTCGGTGDYTAVDYFAEAKPRAKNGEGDIMVFIRWNPVVSHLPVEGLRIASGLTVGGSPMKVCLTHETSPLLHLDSEEIVDGERRDSYLDILERAGVVFLIEGKSTTEAGAIRARTFNPEKKEELLTSAYRLIVV